MQKISQEILVQKYAKSGEQTIADIQQRVAIALASQEDQPEQWRKKFLQALEQGVIMGGRIMSAAGSGIGATLINCFVQPVGDAMSGDDESGRPAITRALAEAAECQRRGGGVGYNFSAIRPFGAKVKGTQSQASGPLSFMRMFDAMCETVESAGSRRGAQMGVLNVSHPDIEAFINAKAKPFAEKELQNFNLSVGISDAFMQAVLADASWPLVHQAEPAEDLLAQGSGRDEQGLWVYRTVRARDLWLQIMRSTYDFADPGVLFLDRINAENNLHYCEHIEATNPCGEQPLPAYGCCDLGSLNLLRFVRRPFTEQAEFDFAGLADQAAVAVRMLDNVLDLTLWPLPDQAAEAASKRRIGLGFTGLGDALLMLGYRYDSEAGRQLAAKVAETLRDSAYLASVELAREKGPFPLFQAEPYLSSGFTRRLPQRIREQIRRHGIRNSHLLSIAPTGTISLAFGDNCSSGIEPVFSWYFRRMVRQADGSRKEYMVYDKAFLEYRKHLRQAAPDDDQLVAELPEHWCCASDIHVLDHAAMVAAVAPFIDTAISKTVNVAEDYPFDQFVDIYLDAWRKGLKGITTYRPNSRVDSVLALPAAGVSDLDQSDPDRRIRVDKVPEPALQSLRWAKRPRPANGNPSWTYLVEHPMGYSFALFIGHMENGHALPFEVWVNGAEQPRGLGALAKSLSMDMRSDDKGWLAAKLESLKQARADDGFDLPMPPDGKVIRVPSLVSGFAHLVEYRCRELGVFDHDHPTPVLNALISRKEPKAGADGTMSWTVDINNAAVGDDFLMGLKELVMPDGTRRPYSVWLSGEYPRCLDGLCKSLSFDMRVVDPAWIGAKLRQLLDYPELAGNFFARDPLSQKSINWPSTVAYLVRLLIHRHAMLHILDESGHPLSRMGAVTMEEDQSAGKPRRLPGRTCPECGANAVIRKDGCAFCTACGHTGNCG